MYVKTIEVPDTMVSVTTDENYKYYWIRNLGERVVGVFKNSSGTGAEGFYATVGPRECVKVIPEETTLYFASANEDTTNKIEIYGTNTTECPFKGGKTEGRGGGNTHYKGTTTTPLENGSTTNPITLVKDDESYTYTAVFGDVVVYGYTKFLFDGTQWSEFGRPFDTTPTSGSMNAVTSDGIFKRTPLGRGTGANSALGGIGAVASGYAAFAFGEYAGASGEGSCALGFYTRAAGQYTTAIGRYNEPTSGALFEIGNGNGNARSNIVEVNATSMNVNGDIKINNVAIPTPYTTMPTITADMLGKIAMYVGATGGGYTQGCFYVASTDGAAEPTYSWVQIGGGYSETVLWENTGTTNPDTITLSEAWSNFDELVIVTAGSGSVPAQYETTKHTSVMAIGSAYTLWYNSETTWGTYSATSDTVFTKLSAGGDYHIAKIIGIKY